MKSWKGGKACLSLQPELPFRAGIRNRVNDTEQAIQKDRFSVILRIVKCQSCQGRKGKRKCPGLNGLICPPCCGEKRVFEIPCPPDCQYLSSGQQYQLHKKYASIIGEIEESAKRQRLFQALQSPKMVVPRLEQTVVEFTKGLSSLKDQEVLAAYELIRDTYRTEEKGVIYEHRSSNPLVQSLSRKLREDIDSHRELLSEEGVTLRMQEILDCLELIILDVSHHLSLDPTGVGYIRFAARNFPDLRDDQTDSGIILTG